MVDKATVGIDVGENQKKIKREEETFSSTNRGS